MILFISILASFVSFLDMSVTNVALPAMVRELGGGLFLQQWVVDAYLITLGSLILLAGSLADVFGERRIMRYGLYGFAVTSILCAMAPSGLFLILSRGLQGIAGALLVPASLALIIASFQGEEQSKAIGTWTAWTGISFLVGPLVGGFLVDAFSWRLIFAINILPIAACLWLISRIRTKNARAARQIDYLGAILCSAGLAGIVFALIEEPHFGWAHPAIYLPLILGVVALGAFVWNERRQPDPMLPLSLFRVRNFSFGNLATLAIYAGLSVSTFLITIFLQQVGGFSALAAGFALIPVTLIMFFLSSRFGALAGRYGPRLFMTLGPIAAAAGFIWISFATLPVDYWTRMLPGILVFGLGLAATVAPLTSAVLGSIDPAHAGIGSAINNAVARIAGLIAIAFLGVVIGTALDLEAFRRGLELTTVLLVAGGIISLVGIRNIKAKAS